MTISFTRIKKRSFYFILLWAILLVFVALVVYPWPIKPDKVDSTYDPKAFVIGSSERLLVENSSLFMEFHSYRLDEGKLNTTIHFHYICENSSKFDDAFFIFQVPFKVNETEVQYYATTPEYLGGSTLISESKSGLSYIIIKVPKINQTFGELKYMRLDFEMDNVFLKKTHYKYEFVLTLSGSYHNEIDDIKSLDELSKRVICGYFI